MTIRVLIVDDSSFFRKRLFDVISAHPSLKVVGSASNGKEAIEKVKSLKPDIVTMDIEMPEMDGITATRRIMAESPTAVLVLSSTTTVGAKSTLAALDAGALDYMLKRFEDVSSQQHDAHQRLCQKILQLAAYYKRKNQPTSISTPPRKPVSRSSKDIKLIVIGTSTGGPVALQKILSLLPADFSIPIVIVQHMPAAFTPSFAERLDTQCALHIKQAKTGETLQSGTAYIAPGGQQLYLKGQAPNLTVSIKASNVEDTYQPCIDSTLSSIVPLCPEQTLVLILTGMGQDGKQGCTQLKQLGATIWAQDEQSSTIYGMPMAIAKAHLADKVLGLDDIAQHLIEVAS